MKSHQNQQRNFIDKEDKFPEYKKYIPQIKKYDYFYETKFREEMIEFPYFISVLSDPLRNIPLIFHVSMSKLSKVEKKFEEYPQPMELIMKINLKLRYDLFTKNRNAVRLFEKLVEDFADYAGKNKFVPIFLFMPQKDDLLLIRRKGPYYTNFIKNVRKKLHTIDMTDYTIGRNDLDEIYSDDNEYGGHYSAFGNRIVAQIVHKNLKKWGLLKEK